MQKLAIAIAALSTFVGASAFAADMAVKMPVKAPPPAPVPVYSWTGFYIGGTVGGAWTTADVDLTTVNNDPTNPLYNASDIPRLDAIGSPDLKSSIAIFGGKIGYNQQWNSYLVGLEGDISSFHFNRSIFTTGSPFAGFGGFANFNTNVSTTWLATIRPRIGYIVDRVLLYVTGGLALTHVSFSNTYFGLSPLGSGFEGEATSAGGTKAGWAVGAGADYAITTNWIASIEYLHIDIGSLVASGLVTTGSTASATFTFSTKLQSDIVRGGVSYKF